MRRILGSLFVLALALGGGCKESAETAGAPSGEGTPIPARSLPVVWLDILAQRDRVEAAVSKGTDMWHPECKEVSAAAAEIDSLTLEFGQRMAEDITDSARQRQISELLGYLRITATTVRSNAVDEVIGPLPRLMISIDDILQNIEKRFSREEIGSESVVTRRNFNPIAPPPMPSPI